jgi:molybdopterin-guanine dinucleotide biosynthesis protein B
MAKVIGFVGYSGSGKTTIISKVIPILIQNNLRVSVIKHDAHGHYKEVSGADSTLFIEQGADSVITVSPASIHIYEKKQNANLEELIAALDMDYIFVEGFKMEKHPKIAIFRDEPQRAILGQLSVPPIAVATDMGLIDSPHPVLNLNDPQAIADFITAFQPES